jgi:thiaminase (transcriptional activator TenA)
MGFSAELWKSITPVYEAILSHPFLAGLTDGTLDRESFKFYVVQDALHTREFARALSVAAARAPQDEWIVTFNQQAAGALKVERTLHEGFFKQWGFGAEQLGATPMAPTNLAYTSFLLATAYGRTFHEALAALVPCYWIHWEVGKELERKGSPEPLFQSWIATYASEEFGRLAQAVIEATDLTAARLLPADLDAMRRCFVAASRYEWMFWEMGWRRESWPIPIAGG